MPDVLEIPAPLRKHFEKANKVVNHTDEGHASGRWEGGSSSQVFAVLRFQAASSAPQHT